MGACRRDSFAYRRQGEAQYEVNKWFQHLTAVRILSRQRLTTLTITFQVFISIDSMRHAFVLASAGLAGSSFSQYSLES